MGADVDFLPELPTYTAKIAWARGLVDGVTGETSLNLTAEHADIRAVYLAGWKQGRVWIGNERPVGVGHVNFAAGVR